MKKIITNLIIFACILSASVNALAVNEAHEQAQEDILYTDKEPQYIDNTPQANTPTASDALDIPVVEETYEEEPESSNLPRLADGEAGRGSIEAPDKYWGENGYPDDISFAYEAGGEMLEDGTSVSWWEIGIVNADEIRKQEIIDMLSPNCIITFMDCKYSYSQREAAYNEIRASGDDNIHGAIMVHNSEAVMVEISEEHLKEYAEKFNRKYGSFVVVTDNLDDGKDDTIRVGGDDLDNSKEDTIRGGGMDKGNSLWVWTIFAIMLIGAVFMVYFNRTRLIPAMYATRGTIVTSSAPISRKETIAAIKNNETAPSDGVFNSILLKIDKDDD
jgi:hypothetical protein